MNLRVRFYLTLLYSCAVIGIHMVAHVLYLYWTFKQIDIVVHTLGGIMAGLYVLIALRYMRRPETLVNVLIGTFIIGVGWEVLEIWYRVAEFNTAYWLNTLKDLVNDCLGGLISFYIWKKLPEPKQQNSN